MFHRIGSRSKMLPPPSAKWLGLLLIVFAVFVVGALGQNLTESAVENPKEGKGDLATDTYCTEM